MTNTPLTGKLVLVTRPQEQSKDLCVALEALGADTALQPAICILPTSFPETFDAALKMTAERAFDWALFSSANGVEYSLRRLSELFSLEKTKVGDFLRQCGVKIAVVGKGTGEKLKEFGARPEVVPDKFDAEGMIAALDKVVEDYTQTRFLSLRASRGRRVVADALFERGAKLIEVEAYRSVDVTEADPDVARAMHEGRIDATLATSSASAAALVKLFGADAQKTRWIAISALTADALRRAGVDVAAVAQEASTQGLVDATLAALL